MAEDKRSSMKIALDWLGGICAFLTVAAYVVLVINAKWPFLTDELLNIFNVVRTWAPLIVVGIVGLEFTSGKGFAVQLVFIIMCAIVVLSMFFPETWENVVGIIG
ncbi:MAG: hypothetical protein IJS68_00930 [Clostridia bacterium]|nr:hypothetical protein [Clostridia bacterium]